MSKVEAFLTANEEQEIVDAILDVEKNTSGEIRVHIEAITPSTPLERAKEVFHLLKMDNTKQQNGVLIYVALDKKEFVIYGDKGINAVVDSNFWNSTRDKIATQFKSSNFKQGLINGINEAGKVLSKYFPYTHGDSNELDNSISKN